MASTAFRLMFPMNEVRRWAKLYPEEDDFEPFRAGAKIREGDYSRSNLETIVRWKSPRRLKLISENSDLEISDALHLAICAAEPRSAFAVLMGLRGVGTPMASAILTAIDQEHYTVIDYRALQTLGVPEVETDLNFYLLDYLPECKRLAHEAGVDLRTLDRALWSWSKEQEKKDSGEG